mmetsp:Transcript_87943/g.175914  ORF Transcript_87943/g.175914 Transcript_87943/m.175914 type:complete len:262 (+) Transcript_87943:77-862(+)
MKVRRRKLSPGRSRNSENKVDELEGALGNSFADFCAEILLSTSGPLNSDNRCRSILVGFSCLLMALPGLHYALQGRAPYFGLASELVGLCSFGSDYVTASEHDFSLRRRRRALAADLGAIYGYIGALFFNMLLLTSVWATFVVFASLFFGVIVVLGWSGRAATPQEWKLRHSVWHLFITALSLFAHNAMYPGSLPGGAAFSQERASFLPLATFLYFCLACLLTTVSDASWSLYDKSGMTWFEWWSSQRYPGRQDICSSVAL